MAVDHRRRRRRRRQGGTHLVALAATAQLELDRQPLEADGLDLAVGRRDQLPGVLGGAAAAGAPQLDAMAAKRHPRGLVAVAQVNDEDLFHALGQPAAYPLWLASGADGVDPRARPAR